VLTGILLLSIFVAQAPEFRLIADAKQLMDAIIIPASDVLFNVPVEVPEDDASWAVVENNAILLAEAGNLLLIRAEGREPWIVGSEALIDAGEASLAAARSRDADRFFDLGDTILTSCSLCHDVYLE
jgi:hypothetical protein